MRWPPICLAASTVTVAVGSALPWIRVGTRTRSSYSLVAAVRRLGVVQAGLPRAVLSLWPLVPLTSAAVLAALLVGLPRCAAFAGALLGLVAGAMAFVVVRAPLESLVGTRVVLVGGLGIVVACIPMRKGNST